MRNNNPFKIYGSSINSYISFSDDDYFQDETLAGEKSLNEFKENKIYFSLIRLWKILILSGIIILFFRLAYLQLIKGPYYQSIAENNRIRTYSIKAQRGLIFDRENNIIANNVPNYLLEIVPIDFPKTKEKRDEIINNLSEIINISPEEIRKKIEQFNNKSYEPIIITDSMDYKKALTIKMLSYKYPGVILTIESQREYLIPKSKSLSHILGYLGKINNEDIKKNNNYDGTDSVGKIGLEYEYESFLMGSKGREQIEVDAIGKEIKKIADIQPIAGNNLILTIDSDIQSKLEELLSKALEKTKKTKGVAIAMDPMNGEILALVSLPGFDNNIFSKGISQEELQKILSDESRPLYNRSIYGLYPSGSTIKPVIAAAALQEGVITQWTQINSVGGIRINQWYFPDWKIGGHGLTNIKKALAESVNSFFYYIGGGYEQFEGLGLDKLLSNFRLAGIGSQTGIDLPGESEGLIPTKEWKEEVKKESWYIGDTYHLSIGQGDLLVTPLQVANWTSMISNGGILYQPRLVLKIIDNNNKIIKKIEPAVLQKNAFSEENLDIVKQGLRDTIVYGSARSLSDLPIKVAGKTGSAEWSSKKPTHAWFTSFAPYPDPKIVVTILIEEGGEGSSVAAPVAKEFYLWWSQNKFFMDK